MAIYNPTPEYPSPVLEMLQAYGSPALVNVISNILVFQSMMNTGNYLTVGIYQPPQIFTQFTAIPIHETISCDIDLVVNKAYASNPLADAFLRALYRYVHHSEPPMSFSAQ